MPKEGQRTVTFSGQNLKCLEQYYNEEQKHMMYHISFAEFIAANALKGLKLNDKT